MFQKVTLNQNKVKYLMIFRCQLFLVFNIIYNLVTSQQKLFCRSLWEKMLLWLGFYELNLTGLLDVTKVHVW